MFDQNLLNQNWIDFYNSQPEVGRLRHMFWLRCSGYRLLERIDLNERVLDVGCGRNPFKGRLPNLVGIDPATDEADIKVTLQDYQTTELFDIILCLGSIQYGDMAFVRSQVAKVVSLLETTGRIYWRSNPYINSYSPKINGKGFVWDQFIHNNLAAEFGFQVTDFQEEYIDPEIPTTKKYFAEWRRI